jgi:probable addiction module antidote protein
MGKTSSYRQALLESLRDPQEAAAYLDAAMEDSQEAFLKASRNVAQSRELSMTEIASNSGVQRETLYRSLSEDGNPTLKTTRSVLKTLGMRLGIIPLVSESDSPATPLAPPAESDIASQNNTGNSNAEWLLGQLILHGYVRSIDSDSPQKGINQMAASEEEESRSLVGAL